VAFIETYQVISSTPIVVDDGGTAISYSPGQTFTAATRNTSVIRLLSLGQIVLLSGPIPAPEPTPPGAASGWTDDGLIVRLTTASDKVAIGAATMIGSEKVRIVGDARIEGKLTVTGLIDPTGLYLDEQVADQPAVANKGVFYTKDVLGITQAFYRASNGAVSQITPSGGGETLAQTLVLGNTTGGTNLAVTNGDAILFGADGRLRRNAASSLEFDDGAGGALTQFTIRATKTTITGALDPTSVSLSSGTALYYESDDGSTAAVAPANKGRIRYLDGTGWQLSSSTGAYSTVATSASGFIQNGNSFGALAVLGTNDAFDLAFETNNVTRWSISTSGHLIPFVDNLYDIGITATNRVRNGYFGTSVVIGATIAIDGSSVQRTSAGTVALFTDAFSTAITIGGGATQTSVTIGGGAAYTGATVGKVGVTDSFLGAVSVGATVTIGSAAVTGSAALSVTATAATLTLAATGTNIIQLTTNAAARWNVTGSGHFVANTDNALDIGASGATRPRTGYFGTSVVVGSTVTIGTAAVTGSGALGLTATGATLALAATGANAITLTTNGTEAYRVKSDSALQFPTNTTSAVSDAATGTLRYNNSASAFQVSISGGAWTSLATGTGGTSLDGAYDFGGAGAGRAITVDSGAVTLTNNAANNNNVLEITKNPAGAQSGDAINVLMGATTTGYGLSVDIATGGSGDGALIKYTDQHTGISMWHNSAAPGLTTLLSRIQTFGGTTGVGGPFQTGLLDVQTSVSSDNAAGSFVFWTNYSSGGSLAQRFCMQHEGTFGLISGASIAWTASATDARPYQSTPTIALAKHNGDNLKVWNYSSTNYLMLGPRVQVAASTGGYWFSPNSDATNSAPDATISRNAANIVQIGTTGNNALGTLMATKIVGPAASALTVDGPTTLDLQTGAVTRWQVSAVGHLLPAATDNTEDIGASATNRIRTLYAGTSVVVGSTVTVSTAAVTGSGALTVTATGAALTLAATGANTVAIHTNGSARLTLADTTATLADAVNIAVGTTTGTQIATASTQKLGFWGTTAVVRSAVAALTNNVTAGGTTDTIDNFTDLTTYANDAATIRNNIYQLSRKLKEAVDALRLYGLLG
jgi:hypothetical protein